jgi:hypothetical protein
MTHGSEQSARTSRKGRRRSKLVVSLALTWLARGGFTHRIVSKEVDAIGESSKWTVIRPSYGLSDLGRTTDDDTRANTLYRKEQLVNLPTQALASKPPPL